MMSLRKQNMGRVSYRHVGHAPTAKERMDKSAKAIMQESMRSIPMPSII